MHPYKRLLKISPLSVIGYFQDFNKQSLTTEIISSPKTTNKIIVSSKFEPVKDLIIKMETLPYEKYEFDIKYTIGTKHNLALNFLEYCYEKKYLSKDNIKIIYEILKKTYPNQSQFYQNNIKRTSSIGDLLSLIPKYEKEYTKENYEIPMAELLCKYSSAIDNPIIFDKYFNICIKDYQSDSKYWLNRINRLLHDCLVEIIATGSINTYLLVMKRYIHLLPILPNIETTKITEIQSLEDKLLFAFESVYFGSLDIYHHEFYLRNTDEKVNEMMLIGFDIYDRMKEPYQTKRVLSYLIDFAGRNPVDINILKQLLNKYPKEELEDKVLYLGREMIKWGNYHSFQQLIKEYSKINLLSLFDEIFKKDEKNDFKGRNYFLEELIKYHPLPEKFKTINKETFDIFYNLVHSTNGFDTLKILIKNGLKINPNEDLLLMMSKIGKFNSPRLW